MIKLTSFLPVAETFHPVLARTTHCDHRLGRTCLHLSLPTTCFSSLFYLSHVTTKRHYPRSLSGRRTLCCTITKLFQVELCKVELATTQAIHIVTVLLHDTTGDIRTSLHWQKSKKIHVIHLYCHSSGLGCPYYPYHSAMSTAVAMLFMFCRMYSRTFIIFCFV